MARGWESKSVESQQEDSRARAPAGPQASTEELARREKAQAVTLVLADTKAQLQAACRPVHRDMLRQRVLALEEMLAALQAAASEPRP